MERITAAVERIENMERNQAETRISELRSQLEYHSDRYYNLDSPKISDFEYDTLGTFSYFFHLTGSGFRFQLLQIHAF